MCTNPWPCQQYFWDRPDLFHKRTISERMNLILFFVLDYHKQSKSGLYFALTWTFRIFGPIHFSQGPIKFSKGPSKFWKMHRNKQEMGHWPILWIHCNFVSNISTPVWFRLAAYHIYPKYSDTLTPYLTCYPCAFWRKKWGYCYIPCPSVRPSVRTSVMSHHCS